jgi:hypothetical protein
MNGAGAAGAGAHSCKISRPAAVVAVELIRPAQLGVLCWKPGAGERMLHGLLVLVLTAARLAGLLMSIPEHSGFVEAIRGRFLLQSGSGH